MDLAHNKVQVGGMNYKVESNLLDFTISFFYFEHKWTRIYDL